jgi:Tol biopolymer transport system component
LRRTFFLIVHNSNLEQGIRKEGTMDQKRNRPKYPSKRGVVSLLAVLLALFCTCGNDKAPREQPLSALDLAPEFSFEGTIIFNSNLDGDNEIYSMSKAGVIQLTHNSWDDLYPVWSFDGKKIAFSANPEGNYDIFTMNPDGTEITRLTSSKTDEKDPAWYPDGKNVVYSREQRKFIRKQSTLMRIDIASGKAERAIPGYDKSQAIANVSPRGDLLTFTGKRTIGWDVAMYDIGKKEVKFLDEGGKSCRARFSKDGTKLAYVSSKADGKGDIWIMNPDGSGKTRLTDRDQTYDYFPDWSPGGRFVVFDSSTQHDHNGDWALYVIDVETRRVRLLFDSPGNDIFPDWR